MLSESKIRGLLQFCLAAVCFAGLLPEAYGQLRVFAKVEPNVSQVNNSADIFDPSSALITQSAGAMAGRRQEHTASLLQDGSVLIAGGYNGSFLSSAEVYNPTSDTFSATAGTMTAARRGHTATVLQSAKVLITGGSNGISYLDSAELYDPSTKTFTATTGKMTAARIEHTATLLSDGKILIVGGFGGSSYLQSAEIYDPSAGTFKATSGALSAVRASHTATLLPDGKVLIAGGRDNRGYLNTAEIYDPGSGKFSAAEGTMVAARWNHTATLLSNGRALIAGGYNGDYLDSAEIFDPSTRRFASTSRPMTMPRNGHAAASTPSGKVLITGGYNGEYLGSAELYDPASGAFTSIPNSMSNPRYLHEATALSNGRILLTGGQSSAILTFDVNLVHTDNVSPNIVFSSDSKVGFVAYAGSGVVIAFSAETGAVLQRIVTGGHPVYATPLSDGKTLAVVSVLDSKIFMIDMAALTLQATYTYEKAQFGFGSRLEISPDGRTAYVSSTGTGQVIKIGLPAANELARLSGLAAPTQITVSNDGASLMVVDAVNEELDFVDASSMTKRSALKVKDTVSTANLTISSKAVLSSDGKSGILVAQDVGGSLISGTGFIFDPGSAKLLSTVRVGSIPGYTGLTPDGKHWVVLGESTISRIRTSDPSSTAIMNTAQGDPLGSANIAFSPDSRYAYYVSSLRDLVFQHDLALEGVIGQVLVGDDPNRSLEQPAGVALTPDGKTLAVVEFIGNRVDLVAHATALEATKFIISGAQFSGLSLVNLSDGPAKLTLTAMDNYGQTLVAKDLTNPVQLELGPNAQYSKSIAQIFNFDVTKDHNGRLEVISDHPQVAGYLSLGQVSASGSGYPLASMDGVPLIREQVRDFLIPETGTSITDTVQLNNVNPNYTQQKYDLKHYSPDGTLTTEKNANIAYPTNRVEQLLSDLVKTPGQNRVLVTGGNSASATSNTADNYNISTRRFTAGGTMTAARQGHSATLMYNGKVLLAGGKDSSTVLSSAETYDVSAVTFTATTGSMKNGRLRHTATLLPSGSVLLAGGQNSSSVNNNAETYDPATGLFTATAGNMSVPREAHTATLLPDGRVLMVGGINGNVATATAELYDPATGLFTATGSMTTARAFHTATLLSGGRVLIAGGYNGGYLNTAEIYDPVSGIFGTVTGTMSARRRGHTATLVADGKVVITGGTDGSSTHSSVEIYDPSANSLTPVSVAMSSPRNGHTATLLSDGKVLIAGGSNGTADLSTAETFDPVAKTFQNAAGNMSVARNGHTATSLESAGEGYLRITCPPGLAYSEFYGGSKDRAALNAIEISKYAGVKRLFFPQFANSSALRTLLSLINTNSDKTAQVKVTLHAEDGRILGTPYAQTIPGKGKWQVNLNDIFQQEPEVQNSTGWLEVESSVDLVIGTVSFTDDDLRFLASYEMSRSPATRFVFPVVSEDATYHTGVALLNANDTAANVTLELWGTGGSLLESTTFALAPGTRMAKYVSDYFSGVDPLTVGNLRVRSDVPVHGLSLIHDNGLHFLAAGPAIRY